MSLTGCTQGKQIVKTEYIRQEVPSIPSEPEYYPVVFLENAGLYCLDSENAKNLLKNRELDKGYQDEMNLILTNLKGKN